MSGIIKGWCPTLAKPMESGDGLLVRMNILSGVIEASTAREVAKLAEHYGNAQLDLTSRGNLQIRGVSEENYTALYHALSALGFQEQVRSEKPEPAALPELGFNENKLALGLFFGRITAQALTWLADKSVDGKIYLSPQRTVYLHNISATNVAALLDEAIVMGFITETFDARRAIEACPGAPACSSAEGNTRELALAIATLMPGLAKSGKRIHVSGCAKGCACGDKTSVVVTANNVAYDLAFNSKAGAATYKNLSATEVLKTLQYSGDAR